MGLTYIALVALVVIVFIELRLLFIVLVEVVVGVPGAADAAVGLDEAHVGLERERDAAGAGVKGGRGSGGAMGRGREEDGGPGGGERQLQLQRHGASEGGLRVRRGLGFLFLDYFCGGGGEGSVRGVRLDGDEGRILRGGLTLTWSAAGSG